MYKHTHATLIQATGTNFKFQFSDIMMKSRLHLIFTPALVSWADHITISYQIRPKNINLE